jgi:membrane protein involved in colicin uptake
VNIELTAFPSSAQRPADRQSSKVINTFIILNTLHAVLRAVLLFCSLHQSKTV